MKKGIWEDNKKKTWVDMNSEENEHYKKLLQDALWEVKQIDEK